MNRFELYEKLYFHEIEQKDKLGSRLQFPLAIIITLLGFLGFQLKDVSFSFESIASYVFWFFWFGALTALFFASYFFVRAQWGNTYNFLASATKCEDYYQKCYQQYLDGGSNEKKAKKKAEEEFQDYLFDDFKDNSTKNGLLNDQRSEWIFICIKHLLTAIACSVISFGSHYIGKLNDNDSQPIEVFINNPISITETK